ncbi:MAG: phosphoribosylamine--glycine ligase [Euryarchaeota archaeon]|nr:phosphoribosylamine--glycine ligase [Euryarchaeota archaeon]
MDSRTALIVGSGGREHAIALGLLESETFAVLHCAPGNAGTSLIASNHDVSTSDIEGIIDLAKEIGASLVVVGPEVPLVLGLADSLRSESIPCFGPHKDGAMLEGSKLHAKKVMESIGVPTGSFEIVDNISNIEKNLDSFDPPWVIKRDVLAGGKGVTVTSSRIEAKDALITGIESDGFVLIEENLPGEEASVLVLMDESGYVMLPASQDHKRVGEGDKGPNTGGMGAYAPAPVVTPSVLSRTREEIVEPMHHYLRNLETPYRGCLYVGLMIDNEGSPNVIEFNVRLGDPEAQVTIPLFESDFGTALLSVAEGRLSETEVNFSNMHSSTVVLASEGYPGEVSSGLEVIGWESRIEEGQVIGFTHIAGARINKDGKLVSSGGRVLSATGVAPSLGDALEASYQIIGGIELEGSHYRNDIGFRAFPR